MSKIITPTRGKAWPADQVERRSVSELIPYARNARTHSEAQISQIAASIKEWGWTTPVLIDEDGGIIAGHGRVMAARKLKLDQVPVMVAKGWSEAQRRAYVLADNQLALNAGWDTDLLKVEIGELQDGGFNVDLIGFSADELGRLMFNADFAPGSLDDQGRLDKVGKDAKCPSCGCVFDPVEHAVNA